MKIHLFLFTTFPLFLAFSFQISWAQATWTESRQQTYLDDCAHTMAREFGTDKPRLLCECMLERTVHRYPNPDALDQQLQDPQAGAIHLNLFAREVIFPCLNQIHPTNWLRPMEVQFRASCRENARKYLDQEQQVNSYCECMEQAFKQMYPGAGDFAGLGIADMSTELAEIGERCLEKVGASAPEAEE